MNSLNKKSIKFICPQAKKKKSRQYIFFKKVRLTMTDDEEEDDSKSEKVKSITGGVYSIVHVSLGFKKCKGIDNFSDGGGFISTHSGWG